MIKIAIPGMYELRKFNFSFLELLKERPQYFYDDFEIVACYGNPQFCIWDGGRIFPGYEYADIDTIIDTIEIYNDRYNIPIRYVFTNNILEETHYKNRFGNLLMSAANEWKNEVVVADDNFCFYLKNKYKNFSFISSTTKCITEKELVKKELNKKVYKLVCLDYNLNYDFTFLKQLSDIQKDKIEILVNAICAPGCQNRKQHYKLNSIHNLNYGKKYSMEFCNLSEDCENNILDTHNISRDDIKKYYEPIGITNFKIEGRTWDYMRLLLTYIEYMVKPEYKDNVIMMIEEEMRKS